MPNLTMHTSPLGETKGQTMTEPPRMFADSITENLRVQNFCAVDGHFPYITTTAPYQLGNNLLTSELAKKRYEDEEDDEEGEDNPYEA